MTQYTVTGRPIGPLQQQPPFNIITNMTGVGDLLNLTLAPQDETALIAAGCLVPTSWTVAHTYLR